MRPDPCKASGSMHIYLMSAVCPATPHAASSWHYVVYRSTTSLVDQPTYCQGHSARRRRQQKPRQHRALYCPPRPMRMAWPRVAQLLVDTSEKTTTQLELSYKHTHAPQTHAGSASHDHMTKQLKQKQLIAAMPIVGTAPRLQPVGSGRLGREARLLT